MNKLGSLIVLIGPSGSGKGTILKELLKQTDNMFLSVSATTRKPREGEVDGVHYMFLSKDEFKALIDTESMLEYAVYCENYYGTPKATVLNRLENGQNVILEIEMQGAKQIKEMYPEAVLIFITPPSLEVLKSRLTGRGTEDGATITKRLNAALEEIEYAQECDYIVVNDTIEKAVLDVKTIVAAQSCKNHIMKEYIKGVLQDA